MPILALLQKSDRLLSIPSIMHSYHDAFIQFKEFPLIPRAKFRKHLCMVSYPSLPSKFDPSEFNDFYENLRTMDNPQVSLVLELPYTFNSSISLWEAFKTILQSGNSFTNIRFRIWADKAVSALAVYEAVYTYCPEHSTIVSSRFNIRFSKKFVDDMKKSLTEKFHYYTTKFTNEDSNEMSFEKVERSAKVRTKASHIKSHFRHVQIFKSDLLKMHFLHSLKSAEV